MQVSQGNIPQETNKQTNKKLILIKSEPHNATEFGHEGRRRERGSVAIRKK